MRRVVFQNVPGRDCVQYVAQADVLSSHFLLGVLGQPNPFCRGELLNLG
jgi:hypothetical protein